MRGLLRLTQHFNRQSSPLIPTFSRWEKGQTQGLRIWHHCRMPDNPDNNKLLGGRGYLRQKLQFDHQLEMVISLDNPAPVSPTPDGYALRQFRPGEDDAKYNTCYGLAFESREIIPWIISNQLDGGFYVVEHLESGALVTSSIAQKMQPPRWPDGGSLGWLITDPEHAGKGLGTPWSSPPWITASTPMGSKRPTCPLTTSDCRHLHLPEARLETPPARRRYGGKMARYLRDPGPRV